LKPEAYKAPEAAFKKRTGDASDASVEDNNAIAGGKPRSLDLRMEKLLRRLLLARLTSMLFRKKIPVML
jgi:hypothetical protein